MHVGFITRICLLLLIHFFSPPPLPPTHAGLTKVQGSLHSALCDVTQVNTVDMAEETWASTCDPLERLLWKKRKGMDRIQRLHEFLGRKRKRLFPGLSCFVLFFNSNLFIPWWQEYEIYIRTCVCRAPDSVKSKKDQYVVLVPTLLSPADKSLFFALCPHLSFTKAL